MSDVTRILQSLGAGDSRQGGRAEELLPLVYDELRKLAEIRMANESPDHTLQPTALVHEAWLRLTGNAEECWNRIWRECLSPFALALSARRLPPKS